MGSDAVVDFTARVSGTTTDIAARVTGALRDAARATGAGFDYLLNTAVRESSLDPNAKSPTSTATGLFQFLDQTWLATLKESGPALGYGKYADAISKTPSGRYVVSDPAMEQQILALRKDPTANAMMAGAFSKANAQALTEHLGRAPTDGELYIAHFLGPAGAVRLISAAQTQPNTSAASLFPKAAEANATLFYDKSGAARSVSQVYQTLLMRHDSVASRIASATSGTATTTAPSLTPPGLIPAAKPAPVPAAPPLLATGDTAVPATTSAYAEEPAAVVRAGEPLFRGLFQSEPRGAVAPVVRQLWGQQPAAPAETPAAVAPTPAPQQTTETARGRTPSNFFQFLRPETRGAT